MASRTHTFDLVLLTKLLFEPAYLNGIKDTQKVVFNAVSVDKVIATADSAYAIDVIPLGPGNPIHPALVLLQFTSMCVSYSP